MSLRCTDHLIQEHKLILRAVYTVKAMADQAGQMRMPDADDVEALLGFFRHFADEHHQTKEESILFPSLRQSSATTSSNATRQMAFEHEQERSLIQALEESLRTRNHADFAHFGHRLGDVLSNHIYKEDNILFRLAEEALTKEADSSVTREMVKFDESLRPGVYNDWMRTLDRLEWKYLNKVA
jgi:hemerythrin-like domain-containing protein